MSTYSYPCYPCTPNPCADPCVSIPPDYTSLGCINNFTECILYNGDAIPELNTVKNENLNTVLGHIGDQVVILTDLTTALQASVDTINEAPIYTTKVSLTAADILALNTTPIALVAAQGVGIMIIPLRILVYFTYGSITYTTNTNLVVSTGTLFTTTLTAALANTADRLINSTLVASSSVGTPSASINVPILLSVATGNPVAGNSTMDIYITYTVTTL